MIIQISLDCESNFKWHLNLCFNVLLHLTCSDTEVISGYNTTAVRKKTETKILIYAKKSLDTGKPLKTDQYVYRCLLWDLLAFNTYPDFMVFQM